MAVENRPLSQVAIDIAHDEHRRLDAERGIVTKHKGRGAFVAREHFVYRLDRNAK